MLILVLLGLILGTPLYGADVSLSWSPSPPPVAGYKVHYGRAPRLYEVSVTVGNQTSYTATDLTAGTYYFAVSAYDAAGNESDYSAEVSNTIPVSYWVLPSSARARGANDALYTTELAVANTGNNPAVVTLKFLGTDTDGRQGEERSFLVASQATLSWDDVLQSVFQMDSGWGAILIRSLSDKLSISSQTSTPGAGGTFGQTVPALGSSDWIVPGRPRAVVGVRDDEAFRTNLFLANATEEPVEAQATLFSAEGSVLGARTFRLPPLGMTQARVATALELKEKVRDAVLVVNTPSAAGAVGAYAAVIDNQTNDPRTHLTDPLSASAAEWVLPSATRLPGVAGAFFSTDLMIANHGAEPASINLTFLGNDLTGLSKLQKQFQLAPNRAVTYPDLLYSVFQRVSDFGAVHITSSSAALTLLSHTSTPHPKGGTSGQGVPAFSVEGLITHGSSKSIVSLRDDARFRTNLVMVNVSESPLDVDASLFNKDGTSFGSRRYHLSPGATTQRRILKDFSVEGNTQGLRLVLSTPTSGGAFAAYASSIDNATNDPRTLLPR